MISCGKRGVGESRDHDLKVVKFHKHHQVSFRRLSNGVFLIVCHYRLSGHTSDKGACSVTYRSIEHIVKATNGDLSVTQWGVDGEYPI